MRSIAAGAAGFAAAFSAGGIALALLAVGSRVVAGASDRGSDDLANAGFAAYLAVASGAINALGFALVVAVSRPFRGLAPRRALRLGALLGALALPLHWAGLWTLPLGALAALLGGIAPVLVLWLSFALPGIAAGLVALVLAGRRAS